MSDHPRDKKMSKSKPSKRVSAADRVVPTRQTVEVSNEPRVVALTGARTFLGRRLLAELQRDETCARIVVLDRDDLPKKPEPQVFADKVSYYRVDLTTPAVDTDLARIFAKERVDTVVHLAFKNSPTHDVPNSHELENVGTMYVLNACAAQRVRKLVMASSTYCYGASPTHPNYLTEKHPLAAHPGPYTREKVEAEKQVRRFKDENPDIITTVLRPCTVLGPTIDTFVTRFLSRRLVPSILGFDPLVQFLHEDDLVAGFLRAIHVDCDGTFNLVGDGVLALSTVFAMTRVMTLPLPYTAARLGLHAMWAAELARVPPELLDFLRYLCVADGEQQRMTLGFAPRYSSHEALAGFLQTHRLRRLPSRRAGADGTRQTTEVAYVD